MAIRDLPTLADDPRRVRQKFEEPTRHDTAKARKAAQDLAWRTVCAVVDRRDGKQCRIRRSRCSSFGWTRRVAGIAAGKRSPCDRCAVTEIRRSFWRSDATGAPANGGRCAPVAPGVVHRETGPLRDTCGRGQLHATLIPTKWQGERWWIVALIGERRGDDEKYWALEREVIGEAL